MLLMLGQSRVAFAMCRDSLLPERFGRTHERYGRPYKITRITIVVVAGARRVRPAVDARRAR